jgi:antitoxin YefM
MLPVRAKPIAFSLIAYLIAISYVCTMISTYSCLKNMDTVTYTEFRKKLASYLKQIEVDCTPLIVTRQNGSSVVVMSLDSFKAYEATFHLLSSQNNATRLNEAITELRSGGGTEHQLIDQ